MSIEQGIEPVETETNPVPGEQVTINAQCAEAVGEVVNDNGMD